MRREKRRLSAATRRLIAVEVFLAGALLLLASAVLAQRTPVHRAHAAGQSSASGAPGATRTVNFSCCQYTPSQLVIDVGDTVQWNGAFGTHPLVSEDGLWMTVSSGTTFSHTYNNPGFYRYYCNVHGGPGGVGMSGTVTVVTKQYLPEVLQ
jgi:plastocyanin